MNLGIEFHHDIAIVGRRKCT